MKQEDKELLLRDLCARLPDGVIIQATTHEEILDRYGEETDEIEEKIVAFNLYMIEKDSIMYNGRWIPLESCKPYLRPMSSMTEEEYEQCRKFSHYGAAGYRNNDYKEMITTPSFEKMDFLNAHHFDYRGLIEKGLALKAPEGMYNIK